MAPPALDLSSIWRFRPHSYAQHVSAGKWIAYPYLVEIGKRLSRAIARGNGRVILNAPPRHGKSDLISFWAPLWYLDNWPTKRVILASYGHALAADFGRRVRNAMENYPDCRTGLSEDSSSAQRWNTPEGGGMITAGVGGPITGRGGDLLILDDPIKNWADAHSPTMREAAVNWFCSTYYTRQEPNATIVLGMTRWNEEDMTGWLTSEHSDKWEVISLPALAEPGDVLGRQPGEALCPERYGEAALKNIQAAVGGRVWDALYQQRPRPLGAGRLYDNFSLANIDDSLQLRPELPLQIMLDFNVDPGMHLLIGQHDPKKDLFVCVDEIHGDRMNVRQAVDAFAAWLRAHGWQQGRPLPWAGDLEIFGDASGNSQWAGTSESCYDIVRQKLNALQLPHRVRHLTANPPIRERIDAVNECMSDVKGARHFHCTPRCKRLIADFRGMKSNTDGLIDKREHALSHASDAVGYWIHYLRPLWRAELGMKVGGQFGVSVG